MELVAEDTDGSVDVKFNFDGTNLGGIYWWHLKSFIMARNYMVQYADPEDEEQTQYVPRGGKRLRFNKETETHHALADGTVEPF